MAKQRKRNWVAKELSKQKYRAKTEPDKTKYKRVKRFKEKYEEV